MIFFMHIAKTAGTSVNSAFQKHFGERALIHAEGNRCGWKDDPSRFDFISGHVRLSEFTERAPGPFFKFTLLRDPVSHLRSHLNWIRIQRQQERFAAFLDASPLIAKLSDRLQAVDLANADEIRQFLDATEEGWQFFDNCQSRYFHNAVGKYGIAAFREAVNTFGHFDFIGSSENLPSTLTALSGEVGLTLRGTFENVESYDKTIDRATFRKVLSPYLAYDCALYELAAA